MLQEHMDVLFQEFLAVELRNRKIRFSWNAGGGTGSVDSDVIIESQTDIIKETEKWYQVKAERYLSLSYSGAFFKT
jgi:laminin alpha 1/2